MWLDSEMFWENPKDVRPNHIQNPWFWMPDADVKDVMINVETVGAAPPACRAMLLKWPSVAVFQCTRVYMISMHASSSKTFLLAVLIAQL